MKKRVFFFVPYPRQGPSVRLRVEQFLPYIEAEGIGYKVRSFLTPFFYDILYKEGNALRKFLLFLFCSSRRLIDVIHALSYDIIFIHREAFPIGPPVLEAILFLCGKSVVFDYDDAIYLPSQGSSRIISFLKCPWKTDFIVRHSKFVMAGNEYLKEHARDLNPSIKVIPTSIDTDTYKKGKEPVAKENIVIGWIGSHTTQIFLKELEGVFAMLTSRYKNLTIHLVGSSPDIIKNERIVIKSWSLDTELDDMLKFDIGVMPMPDTEWTRGKCAFKAILYMSLEIPVVASGVGVNKDIIKDGVNGFLAFTNADWEEKLSRLIEDAALRRSLGAAGRETVEKEFSLKTNAPFFARCLRSI